MNNIPDIPVGVGLDPQSMDCRVRTVEWYATEVARDHLVVADVMKALDMLPEGKLARLVVQSPDGTRSLVAYGSDCRKSLMIRPQFMLWYGPTDFPGAAPDGDKYGGDPVYRWAAGLNPSPTVEPVWEGCQVCFSAHDPNGECV